MTTNLSVTRLADGRRILMSFGQPVAAYVPSVGVVKTDKPLTQTQRRHITLFVSRVREVVGPLPFVDGQTIPHDEFRAHVAPIETEA